MNGQQKQKIDAMRTQGLGYTKIAETLGLSENTVKSYCRRQKDVVINEKTARCAECGASIDTSKRENRRFCSDACRTKWWNKHPRQEAPYMTQCAHCGKDIPLRRKGERKYCSHRCYIAARYKDGGENG